MNTEHKDDLCPLCGGKKKEGVTTYSVDIGTGVVVVRNVKAMLCAQCGEEWIDNETAAHLEEIVREARQRHSQVEVVAL